MYEKVNKNVWVKFIKSMSYSSMESESDFEFAINSVSDFDFISESDFESGFNLDVCIFLIYICTLLNKLADGFSFQFS